MINLKVYVLYVSWLVISCSHFGYMSWFTCLCIAREPWTKSSVQYIWTSPICIFGNWVELTGMQSRTTCHFYFVEKYNFEEAFLIMSVEPFQEKNSHITMFRAALQPFQLWFTPCKVCEEMKTENVERDNTLFKPLAFQLCVVCA